MSRLRLSAALIVFGLTIEARGACGQEIAPLPTLPRTESIRRLVLLSPSPNSRAPVLSQEEEWRNAAFKKSVSDFQRQGIWPVRVQTANGSVYSGEIIAAAGDTFDLMDHQANHTVTLAYSAIQEIRIPKLYPKARIPFAQKNGLQRTGDVVGTILMVPVRILELLLIPQC